MPQTSLDAGRPGSALTPENRYAALPRPIEAMRSSPVEQAIADAAKRTSVDFDFLIAQARVESSMNPHARAPTSSATGLYQFIESTWLETMQRHGGRFGFGDVAAQIGTNAAGKTEVANRVQRDAILAMRSDPQIASLMAAGLAEDNRAHLTPILGRQPDHGELYLAHFLGAGGAGRFLSSMADNPNQSAAALFKRPAAANRAVFYEPDGSARSLAGVMNVLDAKIQNAIAWEPKAASSADAQQPPQVIANIATRARPNAPIATLSNRQTSPAAPTLPTPPASPMSNVLRNAFGADQGSLGGKQSAAQIQRAYDQLRAFGL